jgi:hypothetical protein
MRNDKLKTSGERTIGVLPTMIPGDDDDPIVLDEIVSAALSIEDIYMLRDSGLTVGDVLARRVPGLDPVEMIIRVWDEHLLVEHPDEYARAIARLPDLLAEYQTSDE